MWHNWVRNPETGNRMETDIWVDDKNLGIEYHGEQHYKMIPFFHRSQNDFIKGVKRDNYKIKCFEKHNKNLIIVPYTCKPKDIEAFIRMRLKKMNIDIPAKNYY